MLTPFLTNCQKKRGFSIYNTRRITYISVFIAMATVLSIIERSIVIPGATPGIKLGLANIMTLLSIMMLGSRDAIIIVIARCFLGALAGGNPVSFLFSITGGLLSILVMVTAWKYLKKHVSIVSISMVGAVFHNIGQLLVASVVVHSFSVYIILPVLMISAIVTGYVIGIVTKQLYKSLGNRMI
ncbi:MAG: Heptaprenyl diphosphate synthase component I [Pelotomaculum sp. PtaU1.Bin035]|nr:MAG: Heptaprenyl diphosphate synthase component I [Pelotomaculum sp. PtaU1.Bin035]